MPGKAPSGWSRAQRGLHWWAAALVFTGFALGWLMVGVPLSQLLIKFLLYQLHKTIGLTVLALSLARLLVLARRGRPASDSTLADWQRRAARAVHLGLYVLLFLVPALGYLTAATAPAQVPTLFLGVIPVPHLVGTNPEWFPFLRQTHRFLAILLAAIGAGHAVAAIHNHLQGRNTLLGMWRGPPTA
jgi:cytochrome b561